MDTDISGWVEVRRDPDHFPEHWDGVISIYGLVERNYRLFATLFGVRNESKYAPAFAGRGLPDRISAEASMDISFISGDAPDATWALWSEFESLEWNTCGKEREIRPWLPGDEWQKVRKDPAYENIEDSPGLIRRRRRDNPDGEIETLTLHTFSPGPDSGKVYILREARWRLDEIITPNWQTLFDMTALLAKRFGSSSVRLVVWFI